MYCNNCNIPAPEQLWLIVIMQCPNIEGQLNKKQLPTSCKWNEGGGFPKQQQHLRNGFCNLHGNIWIRRQEINNNEPLTNTATGGGGAQLINHETVDLTDNRLPSVTGDNDVSFVARSNTATLQSSNGDNDVSLAARGNTDISQKKRIVSALCKWTEGGRCSKFAQTNSKRFCSKHYKLSIQAGGGGAPVNKMSPQLHHE